MLLFCKLNFPFLPLFPSSIFCLLLDEAKGLGKNKQIVGVREEGKEERKEMKGEGRKEGRKGR